MISKGISHCQSCGTNLMYPRDKPLMLNKGTLFLCEDCKKELTKEEKKIA